MEIKDISVEARSLSSGYQAFNVSAGQSFKIKTSPKGESILELTVPEGKVWSVQMNVQIEETDVDE